MSALYAKDPTNIEVAFKLAEKCAGRYGAADMEARAQELYKKVLTLDSGGRTASYYDEDYKATIPYVEAAAFALAQNAAMGRKPDPAPLRAFIKDHPASAFLKNAYSYLGYYYGQTASKEDAAGFFAEYAAKYPEDKSALSAYVERIIKDKDPLDKGIELALKLQDLAGYPRVPEYQQNLAQLYTLKEEPAKADEEYGPDFADGFLTRSVYDLIGYANFWLDQDRHLDSVEEAADVIVASLRARKDAPSYYLSQAAAIYGKLKKPDKALAAYGPEIAKKSWDDQGALATYANFWNRQGANLENALAAAKRSVELTPDYYNNFVLAQLLFKLKDYPEALKAAEKAVDLVKPMAAKYEGFPTQQYENLVKQIQEAIAKK